MTVSEWEGTAWAGSAATVQEPTGGHNVRMLGKATAYDGNVIWNANTIPWQWASGGSPLRRFREEQAAYWVNPWILTAENAVTRRVRGLAWHLEDGNDETIDDEQRNPAFQEIRRLLEKPQSNLPLTERQTGIASWTNLISITSRHLGLCGMTHWYLDGLNTQGQPAALLYVNPARLYPITTTTGHLLAWKLDPRDDEGNGGTLIRREEVLTFYLTPPDGGVFVSGLVQAARLKSQVTNAADLHALAVLGGGGRLAGFISPKSGTLDDEQYLTLQREVRNIEDVPDSAKRAKVVRGPIDFTPSAANMQELDLSGIAEMNRDDILTIWGVPGSQAPVAIAAGLNSGDTKGYDEAILYQGAVHDRVVPISETIQLGLLDLFAAQPQLVIEEPTFDDDAPAYELASKATQQPLTRNERRALIGLDPLPDYGPDGEPLGLAIDLPATLVTVGQGEETPGAKPGKFMNAPEAAPEPPPVNILPGTPPPQIPATLPAKADLRAAMTRKYEPLVRKAVQAFLEMQRADIADRVRRNGDNIARKKSTEQWWGDDAKWDKRLMEALRQGIAGIAETVTTQVAEKLPAKADPFTDTVLGKLLAQVARRVKGINETTREALTGIIRTAFEQGLSPSEAAALVEDSAQFSPARAETIARTETGTAYNEAAVLSYQEYGVDQVEVIDGDGDDICAAADGATWSVDEALADPLGHPNCVRDFAPVFAAKAKADPMADALVRLGELMVRPIDVNVTVPEREAHYHPPEIHIPAAQVDVHVPEAPAPVIHVEAVKASLPQQIEIVSQPRRISRRAIQRDQSGVVTSVVEEEVDA